MADGIGCTCYAWSEGECACGVDWTPQKEIDLRNRVTELEANYENRTQQLSEVNLHRRQLEAKVKELQAVIKSHGISVKTAAGGKADPDDRNPIAYLMETEDARWLGFKPDYQGVDRVTPLHKEKWKMRK